VIDEPKNEASEQNAFFAQKKQRSVNRWLQWQTLN